MQVEGREGGNVERAPLGASVWAHPHWTRTTTRSFKGGVQNAQLYLGGVQSAQLYLGGVQNAQLYLGELRVLHSPWSQL